MLKLGKVALDGTVMKFRPFPQRGVNHVAANGTGHALPTM
jgi:hypothetical protein